MCMHIGFRPSFKYYNMWLSLCGAVLCVAVMFVTSWYNALITMAFIAVLYVYVHHRKPGKNSSWLPYCYC